jgi:drug/metabolite transporter superfamily protein YnfA
MNITGHTKESTFLTYIGTHQNKDALGRFIYATGGCYLVGSMASLSCLSSFSSFF